MRFLTVHQICSRCPEDDSRQNLIEDADIFPYCREVHLAAEESQDKDRDADEESFENRLLIGFKKVSNRKS